MEKKKAPQFMIRFANYMIDRAYDNENYDAIHEINYAVLDYEYGKATVEQAMKVIATVLD